MPCWKLLEEGNRLNNLKDLYDEKKDETFNIHEYFFTLESLMDKSQEVWENDRPDIEEYNNYLAGFIVGIYAEHLFTIPRPEWD